MNWFQQTAGIPAIHYLRSRAIPYAFPLAALMLILLYQIFTFPQNFSGKIVYALLLSLLALFLKAPRWMLHLLLLGGLLLHIYFYTQVASRGEIDAISTRDDAVEAATKVFLRGENPWNHTVGLGAQATTGPASILVALPWVYLFGEINWLASLFWIMFFLILWLGDIRWRNNTFPVLVLLFIMGVFGFWHTLFASLDELYFPYLFFVTAYACILTGRPFLAGALFATIVLFRLNHVFTMLGFLFWYWSDKRFSFQNLLKLGIGFMVGAVFILTPFVIIGGQEFFTANNPFVRAFSLSGASWPESHFIFSALNALGTLIGPGGLRVVKLGLVLGMMLGVTWRVRPLRLHHPFWHVTVGAFLAHTLAWFPAEVSMDYALTFVLPAFIAVAFTESCL